MAAYFVRFAEKLPLTAFPAISTIRGPQPIGVESTRLQYAKENRPGGAAISAANFAD